MVNLESCVGVRPGVVFETTCPPGEDERCIGNMGLQRWGQDPEPYSIFLWYFGSTGGVLAPA